MQIIINAEDSLTAAAAERLVTKYKQLQIAGVPHIRGGKQNVEKLLPKLNVAAHYGNTIYYLVLIDFDAVETATRCAAQEIEKLLAGQEKSEHLLLRIAAFEVESWLLADWNNLRQFLNIKQKHLKENIDAVVNSKQYLLNLVKRKAPSSIKSALCPPHPVDTAKIGPEYNSRLSAFIWNEWSPQQAARHSHSLRRTIARLDSVFGA